MPEYATFDPTRLPAGFVLDQGDLRITRNAPQEWGMAIANIGNNQGKWYIEYSFGYAPNIMAGMAIGDLAYTGKYPGSHTGEGEVSFGAYSNNGMRYQEATADGPYYSSNWNFVYVRMKINLDDGEIELAKGAGGFSAYPVNRLAIEPGTILYPAMGIYATSSVCTARFGPGMVGPVPDGYNVGWWQGELANGVKGFKKLGKGLNKGLGRGF